MMHRKRLAGLAACTSLLLMASALLAPSLFPVRAQQTPAQNQAQPPAAQTASPVGASQSTQDQNRDLKFKSEAPRKEGKVTVDIPQSYALVIGIAHYKNLPASEQLKYPDRDAESIYTVLISPEGGQFPPDHVHKLINSQATLANIKYQLETWLPSVTKPNDRVLIYFAGHGFISKGIAYLAPYDLNISNIPNTALPMDELGKDIGGRIKGKWKVLLTDACHSGAITPEDNLMGVNHQLIHLNQSLFSLTASRDREQSFESSKWGGGHGIFTYYVVKGLEGQADANGDGIVTADELDEYVRENVRNATNDLQNPTSGRSSFDPNMVLAYNPSHITAAHLPPPKFGTLVIDTNMDNTEVFVDGKSVGFINKGKALRLPGIQPGEHTIKGVHMGFEPDGPRQEMVYPGETTTVDVRILIARMRNQAAVKDFNRGMELYQKGYRDNYIKAGQEFEAALKLDPTYSTAALYAGRVYNALYQDQKALQFFREAISIDPDYMEARASYAGALLDAGQMDEAVRQLNVVTQREPKNGMAWYLLSQAYAREGDYADGITSAEQAVKYTPNNAEAHFWLAESLRQKHECVQSEDQYNRYLALSNFNSGFGGKLDYYVAGYLFGMGHKKRASQTDIWKQLHGLAYTGLCDCEWMQNHFDTAIGYCQTALRYSPKDLYTNYRIALLFAEKYNQNGNVGLLAAARAHFKEVIAQNPYTDEATRAQKYIKNIDDVLAQQP
ncbi:MAG: tetratricopeptide repeat protein [Acidobacteriaceae bacterium]